MDREREQEGIVPSDLLQKARDFQRAWTELFVDVWASAHDWVRSQSARPEVMEFSDREKWAADERLEKATNLAHLDRRREQREKKRASIRNTYAGSVG